MFCDKSFKCRGAHSMNEEKGQGIIIAGIFAIWLYNTGRLRAMLAVLQAKTTVSPLASPPLPAKHQEQQQGGGNSDMTQAINTIIPFIPF